MGSLGNLGKKVRKKFAEVVREKYTFSPELAYKLLKARDKAFREQLDRMGVRTDDTKDMAVIRRRMDLMGISIKTVSEHDDPRDNGIVFFERGKVVAAISQPFIEKGNIVVRRVDPSRILIAAGSA